MKTDFTIGERLDFKLLYFVTDESSDLYVLTDLVDLFGYEITDGDVRILHEC